MPSRDIATLRPDVQPKARLFLATLNARLAPHGRKAVITSTRRTQAEQNALYAQGRTTPGKIVTWTRRSRHIPGRAWDVAVIEGKKVLPAGPGGSNYAAVGVVAKEMHLVWGGSYGDYGHVECPA